MTVTTSILTVAGLRAGYRGVPVIYDVNLDVAQGEIVVILGSNGAGKTTTLKSIVGIVPPLAGDISYEGRSWALGKPWRAAGAGMAFIPSERFTFAKFSVDQNLRLGAHSSTGTDHGARMEHIFDLFPILRERRRQLAGTMSGGQQRMLSIGVALMSSPKLLLLDEPSLGLAPVVVEQIMTTIAQLAKDEGMSVVMVEQNIGQVLPIAHRVYVMRSGRIITSEDAAVTRAREQWWDLF